MKKNRNSLDIFLIGKILHENKLEEVDLDSPELLLNFFDESIEKITTFVKNNRKEINAVIMILGSDSESLMKRINKQNQEGCKEQSFMRREKTNGIHDNALLEPVVFNSLYNSLR